MNFTEKLRMLTNDKHRTKVARRAGLPSNAVSDYLNKGNIPRADSALRLARALNVSLDWLMDDSQEWPPVWANPEVRDAANAA